MKLVLAVLGLVMALPVLIVVGIALGPAALVLLFVIVCAAPVLLAERARLHHHRNT